MNLSLVHGLDVCDLVGGPVLGRSRPAMVRSTGASHQILGPAGRSRILNACLLYTSDAADELLCVDLGGRRIIKK